MTGHRVELKRSTDGSLWHFMGSVSWPQCRLSLMVHRILCVLGALCGKECPSPRRLCSWPADHYLEQVFERGFRVLAVSRVGGRGLDDCAAWRDQPVETLPLR